MKQNTPSVPWPHYGYDDSKQNFSNKPDIDDNELNEILIALLIYFNQICCECIMNNLIIFHVFPQETNFAKAGSIDISRIHVLWVNFRHIC